MGIGAGSSGSITITDVKGSTVNQETMRQEEAVAQKKLTLSFVPMEKNIEIYNRLLSAGETNLINPLEMEQFLRSMIADLENKPTITSKLWSAK